MWKYYLDFEFSDVKTAVATNFILRIFEIFSTDIYCLSFKVSSPHGAHLYYNVLIINFVILSDSLIH